MKTLALFTPFELIAGGGTRYVLGIAEAFREVYQVYLVMPAALPLSKIVDSARSVGVSADHVIPIAWEAAYTRDLFTYAVVVGNEALPEVPGIGGRNFFVCQFPFPMNKDTNINMGLVYLSQYQGIVVYSEYVEHHLCARLGELLAPIKPIRVIYPSADPIPPDRWFVRRKRRSILSVGRFFDVGHSKRQDDLIRAFRKLNSEGWTLHLAGAVYADKAQQAMYERCLRLAEGTVSTIPSKRVACGDWPTLFAVYLLLAWYRLRS